MSPVRFVSALINQYPAILKQFYYTLLTLFLSVSLFAQCYEPSDLEDRMEEATIAAVGRVVSSAPFYNQFGEIYTKHVLDVDRVVAVNGLSGLPSEIEFFTMGGTINEEQLIVYPSLRGINNADGLFLFTEYTGDRVESDTRIYRPTAVHESYMTFDEETGNFTDGGEIVGKLRDVERIIEGVFGTGFTAISNRDFSPRPLGAGRMMPSVSSISPLSVSAGVGEIVTINGSGFGNTAGSILFDSPDDGPGNQFTETATSDIVSWTDTRIRVRVTSEAGSGRVIVRTASGQDGVSSQQIDVDFAITNLNLTSGDIVTPRLIDDGANGDGGYSFRVSNSSANNGRSLADDGPALAALNRAITTWQTDGDYNIRLEGTTTIQTPGRDDVNIISYGSNAFDFDVELGSGTVGIAYSYYNACGSSEFEVTGLDILFRRPGNPNGFGGSVNYNFGPGVGGGTDFESVALHEIGHTHQLKHVADPSEVMSFRITQGQNQRILSPDTQAGAQEIADLSVAYTPPVFACPGDFSSIREYVTFSAAGGVVLPVTWANFDVESREKTVNLYWSTASETENDFFTVERSDDGENFRAIAEIAATNAIAGAAYEATDEAPLPGTSYYRIAQTDFTGAQSFSAIREVTRTAGGDIVLYPNPVVNQLTINDTKAIAGTTYRIYDGLGREVRTVRMAGASGRLTVDLSELASGQYLLRSENGSTQRFVK